MWAAHSRRAACRGQGLWVMEKDAYQAEKSPGWEPGCRAPLQATTHQNHHAGLAFLGLPWAGGRQLPWASSEPGGHRQGVPGTGYGAPAGIWGWVCCFSPSVSSSNGSSQRGRSPSPHWAHGGPADSHTGRGTHRTGPRAREPGPFAVDGKQAGLPSAGDIVFVPLDSHLACRYPRSTGRAVWTWCLSLRSGCSHSEGTPLPR